MRGLVIPSAGTQSPPSELASFTIPTVDYLYGQVSLAAALPRWEGRVQGAALLLIWTLMEVSAVYDAFADERNPKPPKPYKFKLLRPHTVEALLKGGLPRILIEFFDTISGAAAALNKSQNPIKAANTMLANPDQVKPGNVKSYTEMVQTFVSRRHAKNVSRAVVPAEIDNLLSNPNLQLEAPVDPDAAEDEDEA